MSLHHAAAQRNMRLVLGLLESIPEQGLTDVEWEFLNSLILGARLLCSAVLARKDEPEPKTWADVKKEWEESQVDAQP